MKRIVLLLIFVCTSASGFSQTQPVVYYHLSDTMTFGGGKKIDIDNDGVPDFYFRNFGYIHMMGSDSWEVDFYSLNNYKFSSRSLPLLSIGDTIFNNSKDSTSCALFLCKRGRTADACSYYKSDTYGSMACKYIGIIKNEGGKNILGWIKFTKNYGIGSIIFEKLVLDTTQSNYFVINDQCNVNDYAWVNNTKYYNVTDTITWNYVKNDEGSNEKFNLDVNHDGNPDFYFNYIVGETCWNYNLAKRISTYFSSLNNNKVFFRNELLLNNGDTIYNKSSYLTNNPIEFISFKTYQPYYLENISECDYTAYYNALSSKYIGFSINVEGGTKLGWLRINKPLGQNLIVIEEIKLLDTLNPEYFPILDTSPTRSNISTDSSAYLPFAIYPNPVNDYFKLSENYKDKLQIEIFDLSGSLKKIIQYTGENVYVGDLNRGIYITLFTLSNGQKTYGKLVKL